MRTKGNSAVLEQRRRDAVAMLKRGVKATDVAKALRTSLVSVGRWRKAAESGGFRALSARPAPGRPPKLSPAKRQLIVALLRKGPTHYVFATELWTLARVAEVIERKFGVSYDPSQVWRILMGLDWTCQMPHRRARERDEQWIARWRRVAWPRIKKGGETRENHPVSG